MHYLGKEQVCTQGERHGTCNGPGSSVRGMGGTPSCKNKQEPTEYHAYLVRPVVATETEPRRNRKQIRKR
jgi:hypothetical protein